MRKLVIALAFVAAVAGAVPAGATSLLYIDNLLAGQGVGFYFRGDYHSNLWAGNLAGRLDGDSVTPLYCVDLDHRIHVPAVYEVEVKTTGALSGGERVAWIYETYGLTTNNTEAAAVQVALWDIVYDGGDGLGAGIFQYQNVNALAALASTLIDSSVGQASVIGYYDALGEYGQDMVGPVQPVPEPTTMGLLLFGGLLASSPLARRFRRR